MATMRPMVGVSRFSSLCEAKTRLPSVAMPALSDTWLTWKPHSFSPVRARTA